MTKEEFDEGIKEFFKDGERQPIEDLKTDLTSMISELREHDEILCFKLQRVIDAIMDCERHITQNYQHLNNAPKTGP